MIRNLFVSIVLISLGVLIGIFLPIVPPHILGPPLKFEGYEGLNEFTGKKVNRLRVEFKESMKIRDMFINNGNCHINPFDEKGWVDGKPINYPIRVGMGDVWDVQTDCGVFVKFSIWTDKGDWLGVEFPDN